jgi:hypothetical protein
MFSVINRNKDEIFRRYITMDVTWLLYNTPTRWTESKVWKDATVSWQGYGQYYGMRVVLCSLITSKRARPSTTSITGLLLERLNDEIKKKRTHLKKKNVLFHHTHFWLTAKLHELGYELLPHPPFSPDLAPSDLFLFADLKWMLAGKKFSTNQEVITETEAYFEAMSKSYYKNGIEKLYDRYNPCIALERNNIE